MESLEFWGLNKMSLTSNNLIIFYTLLLFFVVIGSILPLLNDEYGTTSSEQTINAPDNSTTGLDFLLSLLTVAFWSFNVNVWVNLILLEPFRILFYITIYRIVNPLA